MTNVGQFNLKIPFKINLIEGHFGLVRPFCPNTIKRPFERANVQYFLMSLNVATKTRSSVCLCTLLGVFSNG